MKQTPPTKVVLVAGEERENSTKFKFLSLHPGEVLRFLNGIKTGSSRDLLIWMLVLNAARVTKQSKFKFTRRWYTGLPFDRKTIYRSLKRLSAAGLVLTEFRRGKSPVVTLPPPAGSVEGVLQPTGRD